jgi:predicted RNase H-like HicB family nuclease
MVYDLERRYAIVNRKTIPSKRAVRRSAGSAALRLRFTVVVEPDGDCFHAYCPAFKGLHVDGKTEGQALKNAMKAALVYVNSLAAHGEPLPIGTDLTLDREEQIPEVPPGAFLRHLELQWPSPRTSGIS